MLLMPLLTEKQNLEAKGKQQAHKFQFSFFLSYITCWISELSLLLYCYYCYLSESCHCSQTAFRSSSLTAELTNVRLLIQYTQFRQGAQSKPVSWEKIQRILQSSQARCSWKNPFFMTACASECYSKLCKKTFTPRHWRWGSHPALKQNVTETFEAISSQWFQL